jgi:antirestriction protein ArdC
MAKVNVYEMVTDRILSELQKGNIPWHKPWIRPSVEYKGINVNVDPTTCAYSRSTGRPYSLLNQMLLGKAGEWATYNQITEAGGKVKKGEKSSLVVFWKFHETKKVNAAGEEEIERIPMLRYYNVFHVATQSEGIQPKTRPVTDTVLVTEKPSADAKWDAIEEADEIVRNYLRRSGVTYTERFGSDRAFYRPSTDSIETPGKAQFKDPAEFYGTLYHEMVHSTGHQSRLDRFRTAGSHAFGSDNYSKEELVAELGASALVNFLGMETPSSFRNNTAYIQSWAKRLGDDPKLIVSASSKAEKAVNYILVGEPA